MPIPEILIESLTSVGTITAKRIKTLGIKNVRDLLFYFPFRYDNFLKADKISDLKPGEKVNIVGTVLLIQNKRSLRKKISITEALISDETWQVKAIWFNQPFIAKNLKVGDMVSLSGKLEEEYGSFLLKSPVYEKVHTVSGPENQETVHTQGIVPNYRLTMNVTQKQLRFLMKQAIRFADNVDEWLPEDIRKRQKLFTLAESIRKIHFPKTTEEAEKARQRLAFDELFLLQLESQIIKNELKKIKANPIAFKEEETKKFVASLAFTLTDAQKKAAWAILQDMEKTEPMTRLLQGDVGSGKTVVACLAMLNCVLNGRQAVFMAPTEILARQHYESINKMLALVKTKIGLITRSDKRTNFEITAKNKNVTGEEIAENSDIIIGTHALTQEKIKFKNLGLAIIDEQHRFGVEQRKALLKKTDSKSADKKAPHLLSMTATPIPRSLALALYGDLDISVINEMPKGRKEIITRFIKEKDREKTYAFIREQVGSGRQVFVVCPLIDISDKLGFTSVKEEYTKLSKMIFPDLKIGMLHGRLKSDEKEKIMRDFLEKKIDILVATSVIEVGVDVPNATIMMIEGADRYGLSQLHQFRGRVGRSVHQSYCFLFSDDPTSETKERLSAMEKYHDGLLLSKIDLKFRGPGQVFGIEQKGFPELKMASLFDYDLMQKARTEADRFLEKNEDLSKFPELKTHLDKIMRSPHME